MAISRHDLLADRVDAKADQELHCSYYGIMTVLALPQLSCNLRLVFELRVITDFLVELRSDQHVHSQLESVSTNIVAPEQTVQADTDSCR